MKLDVIAATGNEFMDFAPYVPAINNAGVVAFQARLAAATPTTGVFTSDGRAILPSPGIRDFVSHPDINDSGQMCVYVERDSGVRTLLSVAPSNVVSLPLPEHTIVGALGPTINQAGTVGFRGIECVALLETQGPRTVATLSSVGPFAAFQGLPVVTEGGALVFFAEASNGRNGIHIVHKNESRSLVRAHGQAPKFGYFPCANTHGIVCVVARTEQGCGVYFADGDTVVEAIAPSASFESIRGALLDDRGRLLLIATPPNGTLGLYAGPSYDRVFSIGDRLFGSQLVEFALNPVSINAHGDIAVRLALSDGRGLIVRVGPKAYSRCTVPERWPGTPFWNTT
jgi:hypothetical protein